MYISLIFDLIAIVCWKKKELSRLPCSPGQTECCGEREGADTMVLHYFAGEGLL